MRVDDDEFEPAVEDSLCVPYVPVIDENVQQLDRVDLSPGAVNYVGGDGKLMSKEAVAEMHADAHESGRDMTLAEFAEYMGFEVSPWQLQVLRTIDADIRRKKVARGIPH